MRTNVTLTAKELNSIVEKIVKPTVIAYFKSKGFLINEYTVEEAVGMFNVKLAKSIDQYDETKSQKSWFSEIARNSACDYIVHVLMTSVPSRLDNYIVARTISGNFRKP